MSFAMSCGSHAYTTTACYAKKGTTGYVNAYTGPRRQGFAPVGNGYYATFATGRTFFVLSYATARKKKK